MYSQLHFTAIILKIEQAYFTRVRTGLSPPYQPTLLPSNRLHLHVVVSSANFALQSSLMEQTLNPVSGP